MKIKLLALIPLFVAIFLGIKFNRALDKNPSELPSALIGKPLPEFSLPDLFDPNKQIERQSLIGKGFLLNVWATWCPTCYQEHEMLMRLANEYNVRIIGLNYKDERIKALGYLDKLKNPYQQVLFDESGRFGIELGVYGAPETYWVDKNGQVQHRFAGEMTEAVWREQFLPVIKKTGEG